MAGVEPFAELVNRIALAFCLGLRNLKRTMPDYDSARYGGLTIKAWVWIAVGVLVMGSFFYVLTTIGPKRVDHAEVPSALNSEQWQLSLEIGAIERRYHKHNPKLAPPKDLREALQKAIGMQEQLLRLNPSAGVEQSERLEKLLVARDSVIAMETWPQIDALEEQLEGELSVQEHLRLLTQLLEERRTINQSRALARYKDLAIETKLERDLIAAQAGPLKAELEAMWSQGRAALKKEEWITALESYTKARELMDEVNTRFARTKFADVGFRAQLWATELSLQGANETAEVDVLVAGAVEAIVGGDLIKAAEYYTRAVALQDELNREWPQSRFASSARFEELESKRQATLAEALMREARTLDQAANELLAKRRALGAVEQVETIHELMTRFAEEFPRSNLSDEGLGKKYSFLMSVHEQLRELQDLFYERLVPLRGDDAPMIMRDLVDQQTYVKVMRFNPSKNRGDALAVDSIQWADAKELSIRVGWILGREVRLPRADEISQLTAAGVMAEWLDATDSSKTSPIAPARQKGADETLTATSLEKKTQSAGLGFRVVVEYAASEAE